MLTIEAPRRDRSPQSQRTRNAFINRVAFVRNDGIRTSQSRRSGEYDAIVNNTRREERPLGPTEARLNLLMENAAEWSVEMGIPMLTRASFDHARAILALIDEAQKNRKLRVFPSDSAGVSIQVRAAGETRVLDINPESVTGAIHDRKRHTHSYYSLADDRSAAAFLSAP